MMYKCLISLLSFYLSCITLPALAQLEYPNDFQSVLEKADISYTAPLENSYKNVRIQENDLQKYSFAIKAKKENIEIRYAIELLDTNAYFNPPQIRCFSRATSVASNDDESVVTVHNISDIDLKDNFNADWGAIMYFKPKLQFSTKKHCKMLALYTEGRAVVYVYFLFNEPTEELDNQFYSIRFNDQEQ